MIAATLCLESTEQSVANHRNDRETRYANRQTCSWFRWFRPLKHDRRRKRNASRPDSAAASLPIARASEVPAARVPDVEFKCFSQNGEDGILLYLFSLIGTVNRRAVEICAGDGIECNTANLIVNHGW